ncbi:MAG: hypothetical protein IPH08_03410 [Rhodocyclaceae bacterium]|jgi:hypothetical protein|nr:hypothetical protein [Rhodocyclaceae bacterium]MBK6906209.1 hypothetical protein [Rhodocyclaceae bacterium]
MMRPIILIAAVLLAACSASKAKPSFDPAVDPSTVRPPPPAPKPLTVTEAEKLTPGDKIQAGRALWRHKCATEAGEKIYKTVPGVEGVLLLKVRPNVGDRELSDPNWPGAAFAHEYSGEAYITSFLAYEHIRKEHRSGQRRGSISTGRIDECEDCNFPGYRWVDVIDEKDGKRWRYTGSDKVVGQKDKTAFNVQLELSKNPNYDMNIYRWTLDKKPAPDPAPRYGVTFEDHVVPEDRALGVASSTIKVLNLQINEVMGEMTRYVVAGTIGKYNPTLWLTAYVCPYGKGQGGAESRKLTDQILVPIDQEK